MTAFFKTKLGAASLLLFLALMGFAAHRVSLRRHARQPAIAPHAAAPAGAANLSTAAVPAANASATPPANPAGGPPPASLAHNVAHLDRYLELGRLRRDDRDRQGNAVTRRNTASQVAAAVEVVEAVPLNGRSTTRLHGRSGGSAARSELPSATLTPAVSQGLETTSSAKSRDPAFTTTQPIGGGRSKSERAAPVRFNPYGRVVKCELVFTLDSTSEDTPLIALVMEPVYNNGVLIIPAGAELHGTARPDRLRDRIFSGTEWILVFPREGGRINGRQLSVRGLALDRVEPDANGMTWGLTDGSYGLQGAVIRTMQAEEIKRFVATFLAAGSVALQERNSGRRSDASARNTPQNAVLQGLAANFEAAAARISEEIAQHGVFIRVPAGHQFYFYPLQIIDPDAAGISAEIAALK